MVKMKSRPQRWAEAHQRADSARDIIKQTADGELASALDELRELQQEYQDWRDNLPENMASSALAEKLDEVCNLDLSSVADDPLSDWDTADSVIEKCGAIDLPRGFGRD